MIKLTLAAIVLIATATGTAYFYLPTPTPTPAPTAIKPELNPGNSRDRYRGQENYPPETFVPLGILGIGVLWLRTLKA